MAVKKTTETKAIEKKPITAKTEAPKTTAEPKPVVKATENPKPVVKKEAKKAPAKKAPAKKDAKKTSAKKQPKGPSLDDITAKLWKKLEKADISKISETIAIQVEVTDMGSFFIAVKNGDKEITQAQYIDRNGTFFTTSAEMLKIIDGKYDFIAAVKSGLCDYNGDLSKAITLKNLF